MLADTAHQQRHQPRSSTEQQQQSPYQGQNSPSSSHHASASHAAKAQTRSPSVTVPPSGSTRAIASSRFNVTNQFPPPSSASSAISTTTPPSSYPSDASTSGLHPLRSSPTPAIFHFEHTPPEEVTTDYAQTCSIPLQNPSDTSPPLVVSSSEGAGRNPPEEGSATNSTQNIRIHNLAHIQRLAADNVIHTRATPSRRSRRSHGNVGMRFEISDMPVTEVIEMVAALLTKITTTNDSQHEHLHRNIPPPDATSGLSQQTSSVLAFHGKNVPSITILSYLGRIHKYCPTTYEVFLSLLVYFDRMTERVNSAPGSTHEGSRLSTDRKDRRSESMESTGSLPEETCPPPSAAPGVVNASATSDMPTSSSSSSSIVESGEELMSSRACIVPHPLDMSHFFVVDSFNIHRLVIAGVTCASKFFSDVFYTNSRYAKVGGLPLVELNHLEIQFLLLNDFRLSVPVEELEAYGTMLVEFYAREVMSRPSDFQPSEDIPVPTSVPTAADS